ncbi:MAG: hypothetical protein LBM16_02525 [Clostridiales bacterium]|jgi:hypothetical protein|nr:hypothetical protein [Clostridiales bacterium]
MNIQINGNSVLAADECFLYKKLNKVGEFFLAARTETDVPENSVVSVDSEIFDIKKISKQFKEGFFSYEMACVQAANRLEEVMLENFSQTGTVYGILNVILCDTDFSYSVEGVDMALTFFINRTVSKLEAVRLLADAVGADVVFDGMNINIIGHVGSTVVKNLADFNTSVIEKTVDKKSGRTSVKARIDGNNTLFNIGDEVYLNGVGIEVPVFRIAAKKVSPLNDKWFEIEINDLPLSIEEQIDEKIDRKTEQGNDEYLKKDRNYYGVKMAPSYGIKIERGDGFSEAIFNSDIFSMRSKDENGQMTDAIYFDAVRRKYVISGKVIVEGQVVSEAAVTESLYAGYGDIAELTVDWLSTSNKIQKYIAHDTSDDNYIEIHGERIDFITASCSGSTEILEDRGGKQLYWKKDIWDLNFEQREGIPYDADGDRIYITRENTGIPVYVYQYQKQIKASFYYFNDPYTGFYSPVITFGIGDESGNGVGRLFKGGEGISLTYSSRTDGGEIGIRLLDDGAYYRHSSDDEWAKIGSASASGNSNGEGTESMVANFFLVDHIPTTQDIQGMPDGSVIFQYNPA